jgi:antitoxin YefM
VFRDDFPTLSEPPHGKGTLERRLERLVVCHLHLYNNLYNTNVGFTMDTITYSEARSKLAKTMEKVCDDHCPVIITRKNSRSVVMLSLDDYEAMEETTYLLRSPKNARRLLESIAELESAGGTEQALIE